MLRRSFRSPCMLLVKGDHGPGWPAGCLSPARFRPGPTRARYGPGPLAITWAVGLAHLEILDFGPGPWAGPGHGQVAHNFSPARHGTSLMGHEPGPARIPLQPAGLARGQAQHGPWPALLLVLLRRHPLASPQRCLPPPRLHYRRARRLVFCSDFTRSPPPSLPALPSPIRRPLQLHLLLYRNSLPLI